MLIIDASIVIKLIAKEKGEEENIAHLQGEIRDGMVSILILPLVYWEVANWAARTMPNDATHIMSQLLLYRFHEVGFSLAIAGIAMDIMKKHPHTSFYDASYHALALKTGGTFLTADKKYYEQTKKWGNIRLLKDYGKI